MKKILIAILIFSSFKASAQVDSATAPITVLLPVKAVLLYSFYLSQAPAWADRKAPDQIASIIGTGTQLDSVVTVTVSAGKLSTLITNLLADRYGAFVTVNRSIFNNAPAIPGYTALTTQVNAIANGNGQQKAAAVYVIGRYNVYNQTMTDLYNAMITSGLNWTKN